MKTLHQRPNPFAHVVKSRKTCKVLKMNLEVLNESSPTKLVAVSSNELKSGTIIEREVSHERLSS